LIYVQFINDQIDIVYCLFIIFYVLLISNNQFRF